MGLNMKTDSRFLALCHMWTCGQPDEKEEEEHIVSIEEKEVGRHNQCINIVY